MAGGGGADWPKTYNRLNYFIYFLMDDGLLRIQIQENGM